MNVALVCADANDVVSRIATALRFRHDRPTILTTCASNPGERTDDGLRTIRFLADRSDAKRLAAIEARLHSGDAPLAQRAAEIGEIDVNAFVGNRRNSTALLSYLARHTSDFDTILFFGGDTGLTLRGWRIAPDRTAVFPEIVDRAEGYLEPFGSMLFGTGAIVLASEAELALAREMHGPAIAARATVVGSFQTDAGSIDRLHETLVSISARRGSAVRSGVMPIVHRLPRAQYAESTTLLALQLDSLLRDAGYRSRVVSPDRDHRLGTQVADPSEEAVTEAFEVAYDTADAGAGTSRIVLGERALPVFEDAAGNRTPIPPFLHIESWSVEPPRAVLAPLADGHTNLLCVGDIVADNRILEVVELFRYYVMMDFESRLILVGPQPDEAYAARVRKHIARCGLGSRVQLTGTVSVPALAAMYRTARVFVSVRKRYETGLSLLEAMAFDVPICVLDTPSSRAITSGKSVLFSNLRSPLEIAALWRAVATDAPLRDRIVASQRSYLDTLTPDRTLRALESAFGLANDPVRA